LLRPRSDALPAKKARDKQAIYFVVHLLAPNGQLTFTLHWWKPGCYSDNSHWARHQYKQPGWGDDPVSVLFEWVAHYEQEGLDVVLVDPDMILSEASTSH